MTHILSAQPAFKSWTSRIPPALISTGRFGLHFAEMWIAMILGMVIFMTIPGVMAQQALLHQLGMAISMTVPIAVWMRIRGHAWRHGMEIGGPHFLRGNPLRECGRGARWDGLTQQPPASGLVSDLSTDEHLESHWFGVNVTL